MLTMASAVFPRDIILAVGEMNYPKNSTKGFTLIEMILVLGIIASIISMLVKYSFMRADQIRVDTAAVQMQQILNAGMAFYINNGYWPSQASATTPCGTVSSLKPLQSPPNDYLSANLNPPYNGASYGMNCSPNTGVFSVTLRFPAEGTSPAAWIRILAGILPLATYTNNTVTSSVNIPGQNLNNARSVNFGNFYHQGGCVPAPTCPANMTPDIMVLPASLYGVNDAPGKTDYYPLYGFTAYAVGTAAGISGQSTAAATPASPDQVADCNPSVTTPTQCNSTCPASSPGSRSTCTPISNSTGTLYWRVCLIVRTEKGVVSQTADSTWGQYASLLAITRCVPVNESSGSDFSVWTQ
jgi:prepilin-type N-terminal cleavage/methylation domain-containing protein